MPTVTSNQNSIHQASAGQFIPAKVVDVVLDMNFPDIKGDIDEYGEEYDDGYRLND